MIATSAGMMRASAGAIPIAHGTSMSSVPRKCAGVVGAIISQSSASSSASTISFGASSLQRFGRSFSSSSQGGRDGGAPRDLPTTTLESASNRSAAGRQGTAPGAAPGTQQPGPPPGLHPVSHNFGRPGDDKPTPTVTGQSMFNAPHMTEQKLKIEDPAPKLFQQHPGKIKRDYSLVFCFLSPSSRSEKKRMVFPKHKFNSLSSSSRSKKKVWFFPNTLLSPLSRSKKRYGSSETQDGDEGADVHARNGGNAGGTGRHERKLHLQDGCFHPGDLR
jgi:hypothetical protein